jgi:hypothetical protein
MTTYFKLALLSLVLTISPWAFGQTTSDEESSSPSGPASDVPPSTETTAASGPAAPAAVVSAPAPEPPATAPQPQSPVPPPVPVAIPPAAPANTEAPAAKPRKCKWEWVRDGFYFRMLTSVGFASLSGDGPTGSARISGLGSGGIIAIGGSLTKGLVLAANLQNSAVSGKFTGGPFPDATFSANGQTLDVSEKANGTVAGMGVLVDWYPMQNEGLHVGLGGGASFVSVVNQADNSTLFGTSAMGTVLVGYDWAISANWALGLTLVASSSTKAKLKYQDADSDSGYRLSAYSMGLSASILYF